MTPTDRIEKLSQRLREGAERRRRLIEEARRLKIGWALRQQGSLIALRQRIAEETRKERQRAKMLAWAATYGGHVDG